MALIHQAIEAIVTHTEDTITIKEIAEQIEGDVNLHSLRVTVSRDLKNSGYIEKTGKKGREAIYTILSRDANLSVVKFKKKKEKETRVITDIVAGKAIVRYVLKLENQIKEISSAYSDLQSEYNKEKTARRLTVKEDEKKFVALKEEIINLRKTIKRLETGGSGFTMREMVG